MQRLPLIASMVLVFSTACTDDAAEIASPSSVLPDPTDPPEPIYPRITEVHWQWFGCPSPTVTAPAKLGLVVDVTVLSPSDAYAIKGQAVGCEPFDGNGQLRVCSGHPASIARMLTVVAADSQHADEQTIPLADCVDGKWTRP